ncbi:MAG: DUF2520 domain-containing protein [Bacteroidota bacterium]
MGARAKVAFIGAGNLAWHLAPVLHEKAVEVVGVWGRRKSEYSWSLPYHIDLQSLPGDLDAIFLAVPDDSISEVARELEMHLSDEVHIIHGSGATGVDSLGSYFRRSGAFWPIRSLSIGQPIVDFKASAIGYFSPDPSLEKRLESWAKAISPQHYRLDDSQRANLHLASVIGQNFTNYLHHLSYQIAIDNGLPFSALKPLIESTPLDDQDPITRQTGPAARKDAATIEKHLKLLREKPEVREIYLALSEMIASTRRTHSPSGPLYEEHREH